MNATVTPHRSTIACDEFKLIPWPDRHTDLYGYDPRSAYVEHFWLGTLGPATTLFLRYCVDRLEDHDQAAVNLREAAGVLGIGFDGGAKSAMVRTVARACRFRTARPVGKTTLAVRLRLPQLGERQLGRMPAALRRLHADFIATAAGAQAFRDARKRARGLALSLIECGDSINETELALVRLQLHPAIAADAVRWAWSRHHGRVPTEAA